MAVLIRLANEADAEAIAAIYRPYVEDSRISFEEKAPGSPEIAARMANPIHPWLVAEEGERILSGCKQASCGGWTRAWKVFSRS